jgi:hypothetical protein
MSMRSCRNWFRAIGVVIIVTIVFIGAYLGGYDRGFREDPQPDWVTAESRDALQVRLDRRRARRRHPLLDFLRPAARLSRKN